MRLEVRRLGPPSGAGTDWPSRRSNAVAGKPKSPFEGEEHPCVILDRSLTGARLAHFGAISLPDTFILRLGPKNSICVRCWVVSQNEKEASVSFVKHVTQSFHPRTRSVL